MIRGITLLFIITKFGCQSDEERHLAFASLFQDHMVLQQATMVTIWGKAQPGSNVSLDSSWGEAVKTVADEAGQWTVEMATKKTDHQSHQLTLKSNNQTITLKDILLGEVWLASGQSNMGWRMTRLFKKPHELHEGETSEISTANFPEFRMFNVGGEIAFTPKKAVEGKWEVCSPETVPNFSATSYFFGKKLMQNLKVPIGIIMSTSAMGSPAESWATIDFIEKVSGFEDTSRKIAIAIDSTTAYNRWRKNHNYLTNNQLVNVDKIRYINETNKSFFRPDFDDSNWKTKSLKEIADAFEKNNFNGVGWIRQNFNFDLQQKNGLTFEMGNTSELFVVFINGKIVGRLNSFSNASSRFDIPDGLIQQGKNTIAIRLIDVHGSGGLVQDESLGIYLNDKKIYSFQNQWKLKMTAWLTEMLFYELNNGIEGIVLPSKDRMELNGGMPTMWNNTIIAPLAPYTVKGFIWYQGEGNRSRAAAYESVFSSVIDSYRSQWNNNQLPFYYVQLAPYEDLPNRKKYQGELVAELREAQRLTLKKNKVGMAITMDIGDSLDIHPKIKKPVGERLALWALAKDYGYEDLIFSGPVFESVAFQDGKAIVSFDHVGSGLLCTDKELKHFEIAGEDNKYYSANAKIKGDKVIAWSKKVSFPKYIRYGWKNYLKPTFFNKEGLPASSFSSKNPFK